MRIQPKPLNRYPWWLKAFFWNQKRKYGQVLVPACGGGYPSCLLPSPCSTGFWTGSPLDPALRCLVTVRVSQINHCRFCIDINSWLLAQRTGAEEKVQSVAYWRESEWFDEREKAVLEYTEAMTYPDRGVEDWMMEKLKTWFDEDAIVELMGLIAFQNLSSKFNAALDVPPQGFCRVPAARAEDAR